jgi:hypothetical protein
MHPNASQKDTQLPGKYFPFTSTIAGTTAEPLGGEIETRGLR